MKFKSVESYIEDKFGILPERVFEKYPEICVFRHTKNEKWFALFMPVDVKKLNLSPKFSGEIELLNLKCDHELACILNDGEHIFPAYHMNKKHWISINLNSDISKEQVFDLIDESFILSAKKSKSGEKR